MAELQQSKQKYHDLKALYSTPGGKLLVDALVKDACSAVELIANQYKSLSHQEFVALGADISTKINLARSLTRAEKNEKYIDEQMADLLKE
jgi:hypothetical protein